MLQQKATIHPSCDTNCTFYRGTKLFHKKKHKSQRVEQKLLFIFLFLGKVKNSDMVDEPKKRRKKTEFK